MSEEEAFIRSILAAPRDAALRLVYADWLEERGDDRGQWLRLQTALDGLAGSDQRAGEMQRQLQELQNRIDLKWVALMSRGRVRAQQDGQEEVAKLTRRERRRRREVLEGEVGVFLRQYARKTKNTPDPNDRGYSREVEELVKRMRPEDLDRLLRGEDE